MSNHKTKESGFTLIEALVAFLIVAVGLSGAALFQSELIAESGASKAKSVAVKLAEKELEERRALLTDTDYADLDTIVSGAIPVVQSVTVGNAVYDVSFSASSLTPSDAEEHYLLAVTVNWDDPKGASESVSLSTRVSTNYPENSLDNSDQAGTTGSNDNVGQIGRPSGSAIAIARVTTEEAHDADTAIGDYVALGDEKFGIKVGEDTCESGAGTCDQVVSVIQRINSDSPIFKITGNIYFHDSPDNTFDTVEASPNVLTSEGGGCAVYEFNSQASYTCLFGEGWYGTISLVLPLESNGKPADTVCLSPRAYKYYLLDPDLVADNSGVIDATTTIGQSGLVRFTDDSGDGPYLATSDAEPAFGYYYRYDNLNETTADNTADTANTSGNIENQHFVITDDTGSAADDKYAICIQDGGANAEPLLSDAAYEVPSDYPELSQDHYGYTYTVSGADTTVVIPDDDIILGYVNRTFEISGTIDVSGVIGTATELNDAGEFVVGINPLPQFSQECALAVVDDDTLEYTCFIDYAWTGTVSIDVKTGSTLDVSFSPSSSYVETTPVLLDDPDFYNFTVTEN